MTDPNLAATSSPPSTHKRPSLDYSGNEAKAIGANAGVSGNGGRSERMTVGSASLEIPPRPVRASPPGSSSRPSAPPLSIPSFPVLPPSIPSPSQTYQTPFQVSSILSLPAPLLYQLARTNSPSEQAEIAARAGRTEYLSSMSLPPPSPTSLVNDIQKAGLVMTASHSTSNQPSSSSSKVPPSFDPSSSTPPTFDFPPQNADSDSPLPSRRPSVQLSLALDSVTSISSHPAIPRLLGHVFSPPTPGILAPINTADNQQLAIRAAVASHPRLSSQSQVVSVEGEEGKFEPVYASVEQWSYEVAKDQVFSSSRVIPSNSTSNTTSPTSPSTPSTTAKRPALLNSHSFNEREITNLATQVKNWALAEQAKQLEQQVVDHKSAAVVLAVQAAAKLDEEEERDLQESRGNFDGKAETEELDFGEYAEAYKKQLDALASGYFAQLHRDAIKRLVEKVEEGVQNGHGETFPSSNSTSHPLSSNPTSNYSQHPDSSSSSLTSTLPSRSSSHAPSLTTLTSLTHSRPQAEALHIQASAAAAVAANVMAAKEIARHAEEKLVGMGMDPQEIVQQVERGRGGGAGGNVGMGIGMGMRSLEISPESIRAPSSSFATPPAGLQAPTQPRSQSLKSPEMKDKMVVEDEGLVSAPQSGKPAPLVLPSNGTQIETSSSSTLPTTPQQSSIPSSSSLATSQDPSPSSLPASNRPPPVSPSTSAKQLSDPSLLASVATPSKRDYLLSYAHTLYSQDPGSKELLPLLHTIESIHPDHLPTLLLISCVYYTRGELESSLYYNKRLLAYDPNYVSYLFFFHFSRQTSGD